jgi:sigma-E factor negative regulatory protein RseC
MEDRETGRVIKASDSGAAMVQIQRKKMCDHCPSKGYCNPPEGAQLFTVEVENGIGAKEGDVVEIGLAKGALFIASLWAYFFPALFFILGVTIGFTFISKYVQVFDKEIVGLITGIIFLGLSFIILRIVNNRLSKKKTFRPQIIEICTNIHSVHPQ